MAAAPKPTRPAQPMVVRRDRKSSNVSLLLLIPATILSAAFHILLVGAMFFLSPSNKQATATERPTDTDVPIKADPAEELPKNDRFLTDEVDPSAQEVDVPINYNLSRKAEVSVPGLVKAEEQVGNGGPKDMPPVNLAPPKGFGDGQGSPLQGIFENGPSNKSLAQPGSAFWKGVPTPGGFDGRSSASREIALRTGGTKESEAAVTRGLHWLARNQHAEGKWQLDGVFNDKGSPNDIAGTAFGLLPMLAAGKTHKSGKDNPFDKPIEKALNFLLRKQDKKTGNLGGGMYAHGLATIALCEAYALTKDPILKRPAQAAVNYIVDAQHAGGGWRYAPGQAGDTSVVGWQVMALKSAQMAGLDVPEATMRKAIAYLDSACDLNNEGYGYVGRGSTPPMSAVALLCRQYLQGWGPQNIRMIKGIENNIKSMPPGSTPNIYYYYYATQVMHHFGGESWKVWNEKMRDGLIKAQVTTGPDAGSWGSAGDTYGAAGGRMMQSSLSLLTLEVYYRHLPLFQRQSAAAEEKP